MTAQLGEHRRTAARGLLRDAFVERLGESDQHRFVADRGGFYLGPQAAVGERP